MSAYPWNFIPVDCCDCASGTCSPVGGTFSGNYSVDVRISMGKAAFKNLLVGYLRLHRDEADARLTDPAGLQFLGEENDVELIVGRKIMQHPAIDFDRRPLRGGQSAQSSRQSLLTELVQPPVEIFAKSAHNEEPC